jgi:hypothetical protein
LIGSVTLNIGKIQLQRFLIIVGQGLAAGIYDRNCQYSAIAERFIPLPATVRENMCPQR